MPRSPVRKMATGRPRDTGRTQVKRKTEVSRSREWPANHQEGRDRGRAAPSRQHPSRQHLDLGFLVSQTINDWRVATQPLGSCYGSPSKRTEMRCSLTRFITGIFSGICGDVSGSARGCLDFSYKKTEALFCGLFPGVAQNQQVQHNF